MVAAAAAFALVVWAGPASAADPRPAKFVANGYSEPAAYTNAADDFNLDGASDLAVAAASLGKIVVRMSNFDGTFGAPTSYPLGAGNAPYSIRAVDLNNDYFPDLVATIGNTNKIAILVNKGFSASPLGQFDAPVITTLPTLGTASCNTPTEVTVGDLNDDGHQDLAMACYNSDYVLILYGTDSPTTFAGYWIWYQADGPISLGIGDLNNDAHNDLVIADWYSKTVAVMLNNKSGVFPTVSTYSVPNQPNEIALADFNEDGMLDVATSNVLNGVSVLTGNGDGTLDPPTNLLTGHASFWVRAADLNGDGHQDIASPDNGAGVLDVWLGKGDGTFAPVQTVATGPNPVANDIGDFDWDGKPDVSVVNGNGTMTTVMNITPGGDWTSTGPNINATVAKVIGVGTWPTTINFPVLAPGEKYTGQFTSTLVKTNDNAGYQLSLHRTPFSGGDIPLGIENWCGSFGATPDISASSYTQIPTTGFGELNVSHRGGGVSPYYDYGCYGLELGPVPFVNAGTHHSNLVWTAVGF